MNSIKYIIRKLKVFIYNRKYSTKLYSVNASLRAVYGKDVMISENTIVTDDVKIGDFSYVNRNSSIENCDIGKFCSISSGVYICPYEHNIELLSTHPFIRRYHNLKKRNKVIIGNDVLISLNAIILEGVQIGNGAVIGAGAIVTRNVEPYEVVGGVPAKHIKYRFTQDRIQHLLNLEWWNWDLKKIEDNIDTV